MTDDEVLLRIKASLPDAAVKIKGENCNFELVITSTGFDGKNMLQRQKMILGLFKEDITSGAIHAMSIVANTPEETT